MSQISQFLAGHSWLGWIFVGLIAGAIARAVVPGRDPGGCLMTILLGIGGAVVAGYLGLFLNFYDANDTVGFFAATGGAILILIIYRLFGRR